MTLAGLRAVFLCAHANPLQPVTLNYTCRCHVRRLVKFRLGAPRVCN